MLFCLVAPLVYARPRRFKSSAGTDEAPDRLPRRSSIEPREPQGRSGGGGNEGLNAETHAAHHSIYCLVRGTDPVHTALRWLGGPTVATIVLHCSSGVSFVEMKRRHDSKEGIYNIYFILLPGKQLCLVQGTTVCAFGCPQYARRINFPPHCCGGCYKWDRSVTPDNDVVRSSYHSRAGDNI